MELMSGGGGIAQYVQREIRFQKYWENGTEFK